MDTCRDEHPHPTASWRLRYLICLVVSMAILLLSCQAQPPAVSVPPATPTYDAFQRHGCASCDLQQRRVQATITTSDTP